MSYLSWNDRYSEPGYAYGTEPNSYLVSVVRKIPMGRVLSLAEGEGRNAVYLASLGFDVTAVDSSTVGLTKARKLAADRGVSLTVLAEDLAEFSIEPEDWDGIVSIFCHLPRALRESLHRRVVKGLKPGGVFILEAFTPHQLSFGTGGPKDPDRLVTLDALRHELEGLTLVHAAELEREVMEGRYHTGPSAVVQVVGLKPEK
jgi:SAM-dependent methyltransferase